MDTSKTVLIVEDDAMVLESIDLHLSALDGFRTVRTQGATGAISHIRLAPAIDVIVADVILAGSTTGIDICKQAIKRYPAIAVVVITADPEVHCSDIPPRGVFLRKPFGGYELVEAIDLALKRATDANALTSIAGD